MSKPPEKIADLAKQLKVLGYKQEISEGDWYCLRNRPFPASLSVLDMGVMRIKDQGTIIVPIPNLRTCLKWLSQHGQVDLHILAPAVTTLEITTVEPTTQLDVIDWGDEGKDPWEAAMLTMRSILTHQKRKADDG